MLDHIYYLIGKRNLKPRLDRLTPPRLACLTEGSAWLYGFLNLGYDPWQRCLVGGPDSTPIQAFYAENTVYTFLCPAFFVQPPMSTRNHCPLVTNNRFSGDSGVFYGKYQIYILLYQLIRFYLGHNALTRQTDPQEQLDWNACLCLNLLDSVLNPTNLQVYIACKRIRNCTSPRTSISRLTWLFAVVSQKCTRWPDPLASKSCHLDALSSNLTSTLSLLPSNLSTSDSVFAES